MCTYAKTKLFRFEAIANISKIDHDREKIENCFLLHVHKDITDAIDLVEVAKDFIACNDEKAGHILERLSVSLIVLISMNFIDYIYKTPLSPRPPPPPRPIILTFCRPLARDIAHILNTHIFPYFGVPRSIHSENGREFVNQVILDLIAKDVPF